MDPWLIFDLCDLKLTSHFDASKQTIVSCVFYASLLLPQLLHAHAEWGEVTGVFGP